MALHTCAEDFHLLTLLATAMHFTAVWDLAIASPH
jgi:predicted membrane channel-forming protein YqfA (hemolysin III family)